MGKKMINVRFDERTVMLLNELSDITKTSISVIVRGMVYRSIEELIDKSGNWKLPNEYNTHTSTTAQPHTHTLDQVHKRLDPLALI